MSINHVLSELYGQSWYENPVLHPNALERLQIQKALDGLVRERKPITNGHLVAAANFGLWVNLFNSPYEELWRKCLRRVFVASTVRLERKKIRKELAAIHKLRNRVAHYEPIIESDVESLIDTMRVMILWMDPTIAKYLY